MKKIKNQLKAGIILSYFSTGITIIIQLIYMPIDKDFSENMPDIGRRAVNPFEEQKYKQINGISTQTLGQQVIEELSDTI